MKKIIGYIIFVSYNRNEYDNAEIALDDMSLEEFIEFYDTDEVNCKNITIDTIYEDSHYIVGGSETYDDSVYWFISAELAKFNKYKWFILKNNNNI